MQIDGWTDKWFGLLMDEWSIGWMDMQGLAIPDFLPGSFRGLLLDGKKGTWEKIARGISNG